MSYNIPSSALSFFVDDLFEYYTLTTLLTHCVPCSPLFVLLPQIKSPTLAGLSEDSGHALTSSDFSLRYLTPDQRVEGLTAFSSNEELDRFNREARQGNRHPELFALCPPADEVRCIHVNTSGRVSLLFTVYTGHVFKLQFFSDANIYSMSD